MHVKMEHVILMSLKMVIPQMPLTLLLHVNVMLVGMEIFVTLIKTDVKKIHASQIVLIMMQQKKKQLEKHLPVLRVLAVLKLVLMG